MRVGYDDASGTLVIMGAGVYPPRTLTAVLDGAGQIHIRSLAGRTELCCAWADVATLDGQGFPSAETALAYLAEVFAWAPPSDTLDGTYPAARALSAPRAVRLVAGAVDYASADDPDQRNSVLGLTLASAGPGAPVRVRSAGPLVSVGWGLIPGLPLYLGADGLITQARPLAPRAFALRLGTAADPDTAVIRIGQPILLTGP